MDGGYVYAYDTKGRIWRFKPNGKPTKISDKWNNLRGISVRDGMVYVYTARGDMLRFKAGGDGKG